MNSKLFTVLFASVAALMLATISAQSPPAVPASAATAAVTKSDPLPATMNSLRALKEANEQILKKQQATLEALDELQKTADQIKIFSKRG